MAYHWCDNVHTTVFTPRDYQVELLAAAMERNIMICLGHKSSKEFIALKLIQEMARDIRSRKKLILYLTQESGESTYNLIYHLTDLKVNLIKNSDDNEAGDDETFEKCEFHKNFEVFIVHPRYFLQALRDKTLTMSNVSLLILEDCHEIDKQRDMLTIFKEFYGCENSNSDNMPKVLALAGPLHSAGCASPNLNAMLNILEDTVHCKAETASDIVTVLRYCSKPTEYIVQCAPYKKNSLTSILQDIICTRKAFLNDHRYDPSEIYSDDFSEELKGIPDPKKEPLYLLDIYLEVLHEMGPWCANRVAVHMLQNIEKQKIKTPYERHYLLLCLVTTALVEINNLSEQAFHQFKNETKRIEYFSSPKVIRLLEIIKLFKPEEVVNEHEELGKFTKEIDRLDFGRLKKVLENTSHAVENLSKSDFKDIKENLNPIVSSSQTPNYRIPESSCSAGVSVSNQLVNTLKNRRNQTGRHKKRSFVRRYNRDNTGDTDFLCGIIFCNTKYTAKALFDLLAEMSRHDPAFKFLKCQFTSDRVADPITEPKEAELEHRRQEEVLKRFRMHDCNLLIGTSVLEEGMDLPKCNLVVRWDLPSTYRSYVQCKGRARASHAYHIILVAPAFDKNAFPCDNEMLSDHSHNTICVAYNGEVDSNDSYDEDAIESTVEELRCLSISPGIGKVKILNPEVITTKPPSVQPIIENSLCLQEIIDTKCLNESDSSENGLNSTDNDSVIAFSSNSFHGDKSKNRKKKSYETCFEVISVENVLLEQEIEIEQAINSYSSPKSSPQKVHQHQATLTPQLKVEPEKNSVPKVNGSHADSHFPLNNKLKKPLGCLVDKNSMSISLNEENYNFTEMDFATKKMVNLLAEYKEIEKMLLKKCANTEPLDDEHKYADKFTHCVAAYKPQSELLTGAIVDLSSAVALVNKYCAKLPSDTFTKLTPLWRCAKTKRNGHELYQYTLRLPINSPLKYDIVGVPMPSKILARRFAALQACKELHQCGELDNNLQPIGKEGFKAFEPDWETFELEHVDERIVNENLEPRPGTTKRRQYYYKRIASEFSNCRPTPGTQCYLYFINLNLQCPIPEEQNTRGRKIYPPEEAQQGFGILTLKRIPKVSSFPIFTRSGEVAVSLELSSQKIVLSKEEIEHINTFLNYTFTNVLRLQKFLMLFDPDSTENCIFVVPTTKTLCKENGRVKRAIDWKFLNLISKNCNDMPAMVSDEDRQNQEFDANKFKDAVVMPWYRNQDQPQYFYVAEICPHLTPLSCFPGENYNTFKHYYHLKYGITIQNVKQPLLDVDHTSARLNFLTPRYVNRKGVALPTSSEETKRAKRENLEQKQILVPELCTIHPFPASLWRAAVCLPCILYRINGLLLADEIRKKVSIDIGVGCREILDHNFEWPMLDFGWSLSEVLKKSKRESLKSTQILKNDDVSNTSNESLDFMQKECVSDEGHSAKLQKSVNDIIAEGEEKLKADTFVEIGTWSNDMANNLCDGETDQEDDEEEDFNKFLPPNVRFCESGLDKPMRYGSPTFWNVKDANNKSSSEYNRDKREKQNQYYYFSDESLFSSSSEEDEGTLRIAFTSKNVAEAFETEDEILKRQKQQSIIQDTTANERNYQVTKNLQVGFNFSNVENNLELQLSYSEKDFLISTERLKEQIYTSGMLIPYDHPIKFRKTEQSVENKFEITTESLREFLPFVEESDLNKYICGGENSLTIDNIIELNRIYAQINPEEIFTVDGSGDIFDSFNDNPRLEVARNFQDQMEKRILINFNKRLNKNEIVPNSQLEENAGTAKSFPPSEFSFDYQPELCGHPGPSPSIILQALTMSNANDGINLERLETIGDSFLKYAITTYLYITYDNVHEGKLSHLRSKQVANLNLYRLGRKKNLGEYMIATKFEPHDNWLPPCYYVPKELERALIEAGIPTHHWKLADLPNIKKLSSKEICDLVRKKAESLGLYNENSNMDSTVPVKRRESSCSDTEEPDFPCFIPYNLVTQHSIPDKSVADCVEALIGAYLIECGPRGALLFMAWLGIRVLPLTKKSFDRIEPYSPGITKSSEDELFTVYGSWSAPVSPLLPYAPKAEEQLEILLDGFDEFEKVIGYKFRDRSYLLQAMTHASYSPNRLTDCYQRLEFLGDAVLDYLITRHLYEDPRQHSPGALTDLRSALVNNTIFASLAVRHGFHKYFRHLSPGLNEVIDRFVRIQHENGHSISEEYYLLSEEECDDAEDVEVPKALGDVFESIAGAIFLDSNMSLDVVWKVYSNMMKPEIEQFSNLVPKSPIRELLELEPETAKFGKPEKLADGRRVRVTVDVFCKGTFRGIGRNYRIAKCTAAKCALRQLKKQGLIGKRN